MIVYRCRKCGFILHVFEHTEVSFFGIPTPSTVISWYGGICPACGSQLKPPRVKDILVSLSNGRRKIVFRNIKTCRLKVLRVLTANCGEWFTVKGLMEITNCSLTTIHKVIDELFKNNIVEKKYFKKKHGVMVAVRVKNAKSNVEVVYS